MTALDIQVSDKVDQVKWVNNQVKDTLKETGLDLVDASTKQELATLKEYISKTISKEHIVTVLNKARQQKDTYYPHGAGVVLMLQMGLSALGYPFTKGIDGIYMNKTDLDTKKYKQSETRRNVKAFQEKWNTDHKDDTIKVDGWAGPHTLEKIVASLGTLLDQVVVTPSKKEITSPIETVIPETKEISTEETIIEDEPLTSDATLTHIEPIVTKPSVIVKNTQEPIRTSISTQTQTEISNNPIETTSSENVLLEDIKKQYTFSGFSPDKINVDGTHIIISDNTSHLQIALDHNDGVYSNPRLQTGDKEYNLYVIGSKGNEKIAIAKDTLNTIATIKDYITNPVIIDGEEVPIKKYLDFTQSQTSIICVFEQNTDGSRPQIWFSNAGDLQSLETGYQGNIYTVTTLEKNGEHYIQLTRKEESKTSQEGINNLSLEQQKESLNKKIDQLEKDIKDAISSSTTNPDIFFKRFEELQQELNKLTLEPAQKTILQNKLDTIYNPKTDGNGDLLIKGLLSDYRRKYLFFSRQ